VRQLGTTGEYPPGSAFHGACLSRLAKDLLSARSVRAGGGNGRGMLSGVDVCGYCGRARGRVNGGRRDTAEEMLLLIERRASLLPMEYRPCLADQDGGRNRHSWNA
jgi:hypothetical protein